MPPWAIRLSTLKRPRRISPISRGATSAPSGAGPGTVGGEAIPTVDSSGVRRGSLSPGSSLTLLVASLSCAGCSTAMTAPRPEASERRFEASRQAEAVGKLSRPGTTALLLKRRSAGKQNGCGRHPPVHPHRGSTSASVPRRWGSARSCRCACPPMALAASGTRRTTGTTDPESRPAPAAGLAPPGLH